MQRHTRPSAWTEAAAIAGCSGLVPGISSRGPRKVGPQVGPVWSHLGSELRDREDGFPTRAREWPPLDPTQNPSRAVVRAAEVGPSPEKSGLGPLQVSSGIPDSNRRPQLGKASAPYHQPYPKLISPLSVPVVQKCSLALEVGLKGGVVSRRRQRRTDDLMSVKPPPQ